MPRLTLALVLSSVVIAACDGRTIDEGSDVVDAGASGSAHHSSSGPADGASPDDAVVACPDPAQLVELGSPCEWSETCTVNLDACMTGIGEATLCECVEGSVELPPGVGIGCAGHSGPDACTQGAACEAGMGCTTEPSEFCETTCVCEDGAFDCSTECENQAEDAGGPVDAEAVDAGPPMAPPCDDPCNPEQGPCTSTDACGQLTTCECIDGALSCSNGCGG
jgi:hypothetical protein